jgi:hypothetical protein
MDSHGGYFIRADAMSPRLLVELARRALALDVQVPPEDVSLSIGVLPDRRVIRLAYDAPFTYGSRGARWYESHHALARLASAELGVVVHAYVYDADELELVVGYGNGRRVGGERLDFRDWDWEGNELDDAGFEREKERWPLGHLARIYGAKRDDLLRMPRSAPNALLNLGSPNTGDLQAVAALWLTAGVRDTLI